MGVFAFQVWIAERVAVTIFSRHGTEVWKSMVTEISLEKVKGHFIICGYGQVGRTVVDQLNKLEIPFVLIETNEGLYRELLKDGVMVISARSGTVTRRVTSYNGAYGVLSGSLALCTLLFPTHRNPGTPASPHRGEEPRKRRRRRPQGAFPGFHAFGWYHERALRAPALSRDHNGG
jgi:hypothetical protein